MICHGDTKNPAKHLRWSIAQNQLTAFSSYKLTNNNGTGFHIDKHRFSLPALKNPNIKYRNIFCLNYKIWFIFRTIWIQGKMFGELRMSTVLELRW